MTDGGAADSNGGAASGDTLLWSFDGLGKYDVADGGTGLWGCDTYGTIPVDGGDGGLPLTGTAPYLYYFLSCPPHSTIAFDPTTGNPSPGSLTYTVQFNAYSEQADLQAILPQGQDLSGKVVFVRVRVDSGFITNMMYPGGFVLALKSGTGFVYAQNSYTNLPTMTPSPWIEYTLDLNMPAMMNPGFDATNIVAIELHFDTGSGPLPDSGAAVAPPASATFHIDSIGYR